MVKKEIKEARAQIRMRFDRILEFINSDPALTDASRNYFTEICRVAAGNEIATQTEDILEEERQVNHIVNNMKKSFSKLVTVSLSPPDHTRDHEIWSKTMWASLVEYCDKMKYIKKALCSMEFYSEKNPTEPTHPHFHILLYNADANKARLIRDLSNRFNVDKNFIDVRTIQNLAKAEDYIMGKKNEDKQEYVTLDHALRLKYLLPPFHEYPEPKNYIITT